MTHEAGHTIAALALGVPIRSVYIERAEPPAATVFTDGWRYCDRAIMALARG